MPNNRCTGDVSEGAEEKSERISKFSEVEVLMCGITIHGSHRTTAFLFFVAVSLLFGLFFREMVDGGCHTTHMVCARSL